MKTWLKWTLVAVPCAALGMLLTVNGPLGALIWPAPEGGPTPTSAQLPFLIVLDVVQAAAFGFGVAFLVFGYPYMRRMGHGGPVYAAFVYAGIGWGLVSWVPHIALHMSMGAITEPDHFWGIVGIDYAFHFTALAATALFAHFFLRVVRGANARASTTSASAPVKATTVGGGKGRGA